MLPKSFGQKPKTDNNTADWDALRAFMPTSFGKQEKKRNLDEEFVKTKRNVNDISSKQTPVDSHC